MDLAPEDVLRDRAADQRRGDIVEKARKDGDDDEQRQGAFPVVGQERGHLVGNSAPLEMPRQQRETHEEQKQVRENHPLVLHVQGEPREARAELEARERELVDRDRRESRQRDRKRMMVEHADADQGRCEQDEIDRNAQKAERRSRDLARDRRGRRGDGIQDHRKNKAEGAQPLHSILRRPGLARNGRPFAAPAPFCSAREDSVASPSAPLPHARTEPATFRTPNSRLSDAVRRAVVNDRRDRCWVNWLLLDPNPNRLRGDFTTSAGAAPRLSQQPFREMGRKQQPRGLRRRGCRRTAAPPPRTRRRPQYCALVVRSGGAKAERVIAGSRGVAATPWSIRASARRWAAYLTPRSRAPDAAARRAALFETRVKDAADTP